MARILLLSWLAAMALRAQSGSCSLYELDGLPGYSQGDQQIAMASWRTANLAADWDANGRVDVLDLLVMMECSQPQGHGLIGKYYGFNEATPPDMTSWPSLAGRNPTTLRVTERIEDYDVWGEHLDSGFNNKFVAIYQGYLLVPETASYTLRLHGETAGQLYLDGNPTPLINYFSGPREGTYSAALTQGLHAIEIRFLKNNRWGEVFFDWSSTGSVIPGSPIVVDQRYLRHDDTVVPDYALSDVELVFDPPSGSASNASTVQLNIWALGPNTELLLQENGAVLPTADGNKQRSIALQPGLNSLSYTVTDAAGRSTSKTWHYYRDAEAGMTPATLAANAFAHETYGGTIPSLDSLTPYLNYTATLAELPQAPYSAGGGTVHDGDWVELVGTIMYGTSNYYNFELNGTGGLYINGEFVCGIYAEFPNQWQNRGQVYLQANVRNHFRYITRASDSQVMNLVACQGEDCTNFSAIATTRFRSGPQHFRSLLPSPAPPAPAPSTGGRVSTGMVAEYLFQGGNLQTDTGPYGLTLWPDPRVLPRSPAGATFRLGSGLCSEQAGVFAVGRIKAAGEFTLEADILLDQAQAETWSNKPILQLTQANWGELAGLRLNHRRLQGFMNNPNNSAQDKVIEINDFTTNYDGQRVHLVLAYAPSTLRLYINGTQVGSSSMGFTPSQWPNLAHLAVGRNYTKDPWHGYSTGDNAFKGTLLVAGAYSKRLTTAEIQTNQAANQVLNGSPAPLTFSGTSFPPAGDLARAHHILNRLAFGPTTQELRDVMADEAGWISAQMNPQGIDDSAVENLLSSGLYDPDHSRYDVVWAMLHRQASSKRQLREVLTQFWENHFSTQMDKTDNPAAEWKEHNDLSEKALGNFRDLVLVSALSYPMTVYLDSIYNVVGAPNENYARELFELHTLGVNNGYVQDDIVESARCLTGMSVRNGRFYFDPSDHDFGAKSLFNGALQIPAGGGFSDFYAVLDYVMNMPECAEFICTKLCQMLVSDTPSAPLLTAARSTFTSSSGNIGAVVQTIINHADFSASGTVQSKVKTPLEYVLSSLRVCGAYPTPITLNQFCMSMGMELMNNPFPTGYEETAGYWVNTGSMLYRWNFLHALTANRGTINTPSVDLERFLALHNADSANEITDLLLDLTTHGREHVDVPNLLLNYLTDDSPGTFTLNETTLDQNVRHALTLALRLPEFNKQ